MPHDGGFAIEKPTVILRDTQTVIRPQADQAAAIVASDPSSAAVEKAPRPQRPLRVYPSTVLLIDRRFRWSGGPTKCRASRTSHG